MPQRPRKKYSALRETLHMEELADMAKLTPAQRLELAMQWADFAIELAGKVRETRVQRSSSKGRSRPG
jgi:hypothetical protein